MTAIAPLFPLAAPFAILSATCAAFAATNVDSAALMLSFSASAKPFRLFAAFVVTGIAVIVASLLIGFAASAVEIPSRYFGVVPLSIGLIQLAQEIRRSDGQTPSQPDVPVMLSMGAMMSAFLSVSTDNLLIFAAVFARNGTIIAPWIGATLVALYVLMGWLGTSAGARLARVNVKFRAVAPAITACVGLTALLA
ncbi:MULTISPECIES: hypothetical protein [unclassified Paraburkholderia]|uniref:hypothetical protein n=1 Tax=unclassified Paraburkholderia TaxID=2615204 RepID=UPI002AB017F7|nr:MULTISPECIES: hypothetical protein [unclassified Paraburkholderia]